jgi:hypothetical protein
MRAVDGWWGLGKQRPALSVQAMLRLQLAGLK